MAGGDLLDTPSADSPGRRTMVKVTPKPRVEAAPPPEPVPEPEAAVEEDVGNLLSKAKEATQADDSGYVRRATPVMPETPTWPPMDNEGVAVKAKDVANLSEAISCWPHGRDPTSGFQLKVWRKDPKKFAYQTAEGWLGDFHLMEENEFAQIFGGGKYLVQIWGPNSRAGNDPMTGEPRAFKFAEFNVSMPGSPKLMPNVQPMQPPYYPPYPQQPPGYGYPQPQPQMRPVQVGPYSPPGMGGGGGWAGSDVREVLNFARDLADRPQSQGSDHMPYNMIESFAQMNKEQAERALQMQAQALEAERQRTRALEERMAQMQQTNPAESVFNRVLETQSLQQQIDKMRGEHDDKIERLNRNHQDELRSKDALNQQTIEIERGAASRREESLRNEWTMRERLMTDSFERKLTEAREDRNREIDGMRREHERTLASMREDFTRTIESTRADLTRDKEMQKQLAESNLVVYRAEVERLRAENVRLIGENDNLKAKVFRAPQEAIKDAVNLARGVGYVHSSEMPEQEEKPSRFDTFMEKVAPAIAPQVVTMVGNLVQQGMGGNRPATPPPQQPQQAQAPALTGGQPQQQPRRGAPRGMQRFQQPVISLGDGDEDVAVSYDSPMPVASHGEVYFKPAAPQPAHEQAVAPQSPPPPPPPQPPPPQQQPAQAQSGRIATRGPQPMPDEQLRPLLQMFMTAATSAAEQEAPPEEFARQVAGVLPDGAAAALAAWIDGDNAAILAEALTGPNGGWDTGARQRWMREAWEEIERVGAKK
jgi:hypothetical protein